MAGSQVSKTVAIDYFQEAVLGYSAANISNYDNTSEPKVQAGSVIEISQELYEFSSEESITGWSGIANATQAYIYFVPAGTSCTVIFSSTTPTWSNAKNGWYNGNNRAEWAVYRTNSTTYSNKYRLSNQSINRQGDQYNLGALDVTGAITTDVGVDSITDGTNRLRPKLINIGDWDMATTASVSITHGLTLSTIRGVNAVIRDDAATSLDPIYSFANTTDPGLLSGGVTTIDATNITLARRAGGQFDSANYNDTSYNRGWITVWYED